MSSQIVTQESDGLAYNPKAAEINVQLGANYIASENYQAADEKLKRAFVQDPKSSKARWIYAVLQERLEQTERAEEYYKKAIAIDNKDSSGLYNYATFLCRYQRYQESQKYFSLVLADPLYPSRANAFLTAGVCAMEIPNYDDAEEYFKQSLRLESGQRVALYQLAKLNFKTQNFEQAQNSLVEFEGLSQHTAESLLLAHEIELALGNQTKAQVYAEQLTTHFPASVQALKLVD
jgi:type IV pilus assembly protein PilF